jgi:hypothetical protein
MAANHISNMVFSSYKNISIHFIVHHEGHVTEALGLAAQEILWHPAAETALHFLTRSKENKKSDILGIAYAQNHSFFLSRSNPRYLCVCTLNLGAHETLESLKQTAWHQAWHIINRVTNHESNARPVKRRDSDQAAHQIIQPPKDIVATARYNLSADTFSALMSGYEGDTKTSQEIAKTRSQDILSKNTYSSPEHYPFPIAFDTANEALKIFVNKSWAKRRVVTQAIRLTENLNNTFNDDALKHWVLFAAHSQNMVWRNISKADILGAAIHMAGNTQTRIISHQIADLLEIKPSSVIDATEFYNNFMAHKMAENIHNHIIDDTFIKCLTQSLKIKSGRPLLEAADKQNTTLSNGEINGWCALALQYAAAAVDLAFEQGHNPEALAKKEFAACRQKVTLKELRTINRLIIQEKRKGGTITMDKLKALCTHDDTLKLIHKSIKATLTAEDTRARETNVA